MAPHEQASGDRSREVLKEALTLISRHGTNYTPISYAVWYEVACGTKPALERDVQSALERGERLSADLTYDLYQKHVLEAGERELIASKARLEKVVADVQGSVTQTSASTETFQSSLSAFGEGIARVGTAGDLKRFVAGMLDDVRTFDRSMHDLNNALDTSHAEIRRLTEELERTRAASSVDGLTELANRRTFDEASRRHFDEARARGCPLSLVMIDIDHFKRINDRYGHPFGDRVIQGVANAIRGATPATGIAARYGGEEFCVLLPQASLDAARGIAEHIRATVAASRIRQVGRDDALGGVTVSAGVAQAGERETLAAFIERADRALYAAKDGGRNRVHADAH